MKIVFVRFGFYADIPIPFTKRIIVLDTGWRRFEPRDWYSIWSLGWKCTYITRTRAPVPSGMGVPLLSDTRIFVRAISLTLLSLIRVTARGGYNMRPIPSTITDPAATRFLFDRDPGDETDRTSADRILLDQDEYHRRLRAAYEEGHIAATMAARKRLHTVAQQLLATVENL